MPSLRDRRFLFATKSDLTPRLRVIERDAALEYVPYEIRDDEVFAVVHALSAQPGLGLTTAPDKSLSPRYLIFRRGHIPQPRRIPQRRGGVKYIIDPTPHCLILVCGGLHVDTGVLIGGELMQPLDASDHALDLFRLLCRELCRGFARVKLYRVGPEALARLRAGQRLAPTSVRAPGRYDLTEGGSIAEPDQHP